MLFAMVPCIAACIASYIPCGSWLRACCLNGRWRLLRTSRKNNRVKYAVNDQMELSIRSFSHTASHIDLIVIDGQASLPTDDMTSFSAAATFSIAYPAIGSVFSGPWRCSAQSFYGGAPIQIEFEGAPSEWEPVGKSCRLSRPFYMPSRFTSKPLCALVEVAMVEQAEEQQIKVRIRRRTCFVASLSPDNDNELIVSRGYSTDSGGHRRPTWKLRRVMQSNSEHGPSASNDLVSWAVGKGKSAFAGEWRGDGFYNGCVISIDSNGDVASWGPQTGLDYEGVDSAAVFFKVDLIDLIDHEFVPTHVLHGGGAHGLHEESATKTGIRAGVLGTIASSFSSLLDGSFSRKQSPSASLDGADSRSFSKKVDGSFRRKEPAQSAVPVEVHYVCSQPEPQMLRVSLSYGDEGHEGIDGTSEDEEGQWTLERISACDCPEPRQPEVWHGETKHCPQMTRTYKHIHREQASRASMRSSTSLVPLPRFFKDRLGSRQEAVEARASAHQQAILAVFGTASSPSDDGREKTTTLPWRTTLVDRVSKAINGLPQFMPPGVRNDGPSQAFQQQRDWLNTQFKTSFSFTRSFHKGGSFSGKPSRGSFSRKFSSSFSSTRSAASSEPRAIFFDRAPPPSDSAPASAVEGTSTTAAVPASILSNAGLKLSSHHGKANAQLVNVTPDETIDFKEVSCTSSLARARAARMIGAATLSDQLQGDPPRSVVSFSPGVGSPELLAKGKAAAVAGKKRRVYSNESGTSSSGSSNANTVSEGLAYFEGLAYSNSSEGLAI